MTIVRFEMTDADGNRFLAFGLAPPDAAEATLRALARKRRRQPAVCTIDGCDRAPASRGWCRKHYERWRRHGDPLTTLPRGGVRQPPAVCSIDGRERATVARGWCMKHYKRWHVGKDPAVPSPQDRGRASCSVTGCQRTYRQDGYCGMHYARVKKHGDPGPIDALDRRTPANTLRCAIDGCERRAVSVRIEICQMHYHRKRHDLPLDAPVGSLATRSYPPPQIGVCTRDGCDGAYYARGLCRACYANMRYRERRKQTA